MERPLCRPPKMIATKRGTSTEGWLPLGIRVHLIRRFGSEMTQPVRLDANHRWGRLARTSHAGSYGPSLLPQQLYSKSWATPRPQPCPNTSLDTSGTSLQNRRRASKPLSRTWLKQGFILKPSTTRTRPMTTRRCCV